MPVHTFHPFELERWLSDFEQTVKFNLSESGIHPLTLRELIGDADKLDALLATPLNYPQVNGADELRARIAALYEGASIDNVLVTVGAAEANYIAIQTLAKGSVAVMLPNYLQVWGAARNMGVAVRGFRLRASRGWALDLDTLDESVDHTTSVISVCNPNNPTGYILTRQEMDAIVRTASRVGAWIMTDEVYAGAERQAGVATPSFWGLYDKVVAVNSLSKAYGLPGLRVGWLVAPVGVVSSLWRHHEYTTIAATMLSNKLATLALSTQVRPRLLSRSRQYVRHGYFVVESWLQRHKGVLSCTPPQAAAMAFVRYDLDMESAMLVDRLRREWSILVVPGAFAGAERHLRISFGLPESYLRGGLGRISECLRSLT